MVYQDNYHNLVTRAVLNYERMLEAAKRRDEIIEAAEGNTSFIEAQGNATEYREVRSNFNEANMLLIGVRQQLDDVGAEGFVRFEEMLRSRSPELADKIMEKINPKTEASENENPKETRIPEPKKPFWKRWMS